MSAMKKCIVISDSFKGTLSSLEICRIASETVPHIFPQCQVLTIPVADGGEGTVECFMSALRTGPVSVDVRGPNGQAVSAVYTRSGTKAVIEMAAAAGLMGASDAAAVVPFFLLYALAGGAVILGVLCAMAQRLREMDVDTLTPLEAMNLLYQLKREL